MSITLRDYKHAYNLYVTGNMRLSPKFKHLFSTVFTVSSYAKSMVKGLDSVDMGEVSLLCRASDLPKYDLQTETLNQYNRKKVIHTSVQYQPLTLQFHDDNAGLTTLLWETYFRYYYADSNYTTTPGSVSREYQKGPGGISSSYANESFVSYRYGLDMPSKLQNFFTSIQLLQFHPQNKRTTYTSYTLVNPKISAFQHDNVTQDGSEFTINSLTLSYEAVFYNRGEVVITQNESSANYYDTFVSPNPIYRPENTVNNGGSIVGSNNTARAWLTKFR